MNLQDFENIVPAETAQQFQAQRQLEINQAFTELGWPFGPSPLDRSKSIAQFRQEGLSAGLLDPVSSFGLNNTADLSAPELSLLEQCCTLEGKLHLKQLPTTGSTTLLSRVLHFRLIKLGLYKGQANDPMSSATQQALIQLQEWLNLNGDLVKVANIAGDLKTLIQQLLKSKQLDNKVALFQWDAPLMNSQQKADLAEESDESDQESQLIQEEQSIDRSIRRAEARYRDKIAKSVKTAEDVEMAVPLNSREGRAKRIKLLMRSILNDQRQLLEEQLAKEAKVRAAIEQASERKERRRLERALARLIRQRKEEQGAKQRELRELQERLTHLSLKINGLKFKFKAKLKRSLSEQAYPKIRQEVFINY